MLVTKPTGVHVPIKMWLDDIEDVAMAQAVNLATLPFVFKHVALMPDCHLGYGMPIGGVLATKDVIIPNGTGVDISCGVAYAETNIHRGSLTPQDYKELVGNIMRGIPTGFNHHKTVQPCKALDDVGAFFGAKDWPELHPEVAKSYFQVGTLGGGNHFIELQEDEHGMLSIMLHSGSRNLGYQIAKYFNELAKSLNGKWFSSVPKEAELAFLPVDSAEGQGYIMWMNLAMTFARESRQRMLDVVKALLLAKVPAVEFTNELNVHHNYATLENHFGENVWVHRKGAIRARAGELGIIPGAMGSYSYIVEGLGNKDSFQSCSHGAGRRMGRKEATRQFTVEQTMVDLKAKGVVLGKAGKGSVTEECVWAYKDIDAVIASQLDLIKPLKKLKTVVVVKG